MKVHEGAVLGKAICYGIDCFVPQAALVQDEELSKATEAQIDNQGIHNVKSHEHLMMQIARMSRLRGWRSQ
eukprot:2895064-Amphidinium_carterae.3